MRRTSSSAPTAIGRTRAQEFDDWSDPETSPTARTAVLRSSRGQRPPLEAVTSASVRVHLVVPQSFADAQGIADKYKDTVPVILNLQSTDAELSKRLIDFSSGL